MMRELGTVSRSEIPALLPDCTKTELHAQLRYFLAKGVVEQDGGLLHACKVLSIADEGKTFKNIIRFDGFNMEAAHILGLYGYIGDDKISMFAVDFPPELEGIIRALAVGSS